MLSNTGEEDSVQENLRKDAKNYMNYLLSHKEKILFCYICKRPNGPNAI
jgi:hypothetical protein